MGKRIKKLWRGLIVCIRFMKALAFKRLKDIPAELGTSLGLGSLFLGLGGCRVQQKDSQGLRLSRVIKCMGKRIFRIRG